MAATPRFKIFTPGGEYVAACKYAEDAGALVSLRGPGATIRTGHGRRDIVWTEGLDGVAYYSYEATAKTIADRSEAASEGGEDATVPR